jgi:chromosome partitioning protein
MEDNTSLTDAADSKAPAKIAAKPVVAAFVANKGGVGKTRHTILLANYLGKAGKKVCVIDMDYNNSTGFYYLPKTEDDRYERLAETKNIADALRQERLDMNDFVLPTIRPNVDIIAASRYMSDIRAINERRLTRSIQSLRGRYDAVIIDCKPDYDNITLNAINAADFIISPAERDLDNLNAAVFLDEKLAQDTDKRGAWYLTVNGFDRRYENAESGKQREYILKFQDTFSPSRFAPREAWFPWCADMNEIKDRRRLLSEEPYINPEDKQPSVRHPALYRAVRSLACWVMRENLDAPEAF